MNDSKQMTLWNLDRESQHLSGQNDPNTPIIISTLPTIVFTPANTQLSLEQVFKHINSEIEMV